MPDNNDLRCECGHRLDAHETHDPETYFYCETENCYCGNFEADKFQSFGEHPHTPTEYKTIRNEQTVC